MGLEGNPAMKILESQAEFSKGNLHRNPFYGTCFPPYATCLAFVKT
jgi:hypothetical protein